MRPIAAFAVLTLAALANANQVTLTTSCIGHTCTGWATLCGGAPITFDDETSDAVPEGTGHTLLAFDIASQLPSGSRINAATLHFSVNVFHSGQTQLRAVTTSWPCGTVNWAGPAEGTGIPAGGVLATSSTGFPSTGSCSYSSTALVAWIQAALDVPSSNHGLLVMPGGGIDSFVEAYISSSVSLDIDFDAPCPAPVNYCIGAPNSVGPGARIAISGSTRISDNAMTIVATGMRPGATAFCFFGGAQQQTPLGNGWLCAGGTIYRLLPGLFADATGSITRPVNFNVGTAQNITAGSMWNFQVEYRDVHGGGAGFNLSDAVAVTFCP